MNRDYRLNFCRICSNRKLNLKHGIVCGLTNELATFNDSCESYKKDTEEISKRLKQFEKYKKDRYPQNDLEKLIVDFRFSEINFDRFNKYKTVEQTHDVIFKKNNFDDFLFLIIVFMTYLLYVIFNGKDFEFSFQSPVFNFSILFLVVFFFFFYRAFYVVYKPEITILKEGVLHKSIMIHWSSILSIGLETGTGENRGVNNLVLCTISNHVYKINLNNFSSNTQDILQMVYLNFKNNNM